MSCKIQNRSCKEVGRAPAQSVQHKAGCTDEVTHSGSVTVTTVGPAPSKYKWAESNSYAQRDESSVNAWADPGFPIGGGTQRSGCAIRTRRVPLLDGAAIRDGMQNYITGVSVLALIIIFWHSGESPKQRFRGAKDVSEGCRDNFRRPRDTCPHAPRSAHTLKDKGSPLLHARKAFHASASAATLH